MTKGKFGLSTAAIAVIAFVFAALRQPVPVLLVAGFALLAERDEWLSRQTVQALLLVVSYHIIDLVAGWVFGGLGRFFGWVRFYWGQGAFGTLSSVMSGLIYAALIVLSVIAIIRVMGGKEANLPVLSKMAGGDFSKAFERAQAAPAAPSARGPEAAVSPVAAPAQKAPPAEPVVAKPAGQQAQAAYEPSVAAQAVVSPKLCAVCSAPLEKDSRFCTGCGARV